MLVKRLQDRMYPPEVRPTPCSVRVWSENRHPVSPILLLRGVANFLMQIQDLYRAPPKVIDALLGSMPLFKQVYQMDPGQLDVLLRYSQLLEARPGEVVIEAGQIDTWLYFLLKGQLVVYAGEQAVRRVNTITPGEIFGDMAVLLDLPRSATVITDIKTRHSLIVRTDYSVFGEPEDMGCIQLPVKLLFGRTMVHNLRWKLELYRSQFPHHQFAAEHLKVRLYTGPKNTLQELKSLDQQARNLADLLIRWNLALTHDDG